MYSIRRTALAALLTIGLLLAVQTPASAVFARSVFASEAFNFVEVCPDYVSFEVARYAEHDQAGGHEPPVDTMVTIQAVTPPPHRVDPSRRVRAQPAGIAARLRPTAEHRAA